LPGVKQKRSHHGSFSDYIDKGDQAVHEDVLFGLKYDPKITSSDIAVAVNDGDIAAR
jgi:hypothetical protein